VENATAERLLDLNRQFYQTYALQFSATRQRLQPGVQRLLGTIQESQATLDLGCGNGQLARALHQRGFMGSYTGLDQSSQLLEEARASLPGEVRFLFLPADLASPDWEAMLPASQFDRVLAFAVLHHLPGQVLRRQVLEQVHSLLKPGGLFLHSEWQFLASERLRSRIRPWEVAGLSPQQVDLGDYLLDWRQGGSGLRYVHHFSESELAGLADETGFTIQETTYSDGQGGRLGLYQIWKRV
jgi:tRNA (uracil-5-)-methyltransferase TRM9